MIACISMQTGSAAPQVQQRDGSARDSGEDQRGRKAVQTGVSEREEKQRDQSSNPAAACEGGELLNAIAAIL